MNAKKKERLKDLLAHLNKVIDTVNKLSESKNKELRKIHPEYVKAAKNLIHYRALRSKDLRYLQKQLSFLGISRLSKIESHTMASLMAARSYLKALITGNPINFKKAELSFKQSGRQSARNTKALLGYRSKKRRGRIMVTLPTEAAADYELVKEMVLNGMNCARINCAHDSSIEWKKMIENVRLASKKLSKKCLVAMDLGGPKIRTGPITPGPKIKKFKPVRNIRGEVVKPSMLWLGPDTNFFMGIQSVSVDKPILAILRIGDVLYFRDTRNKKRQLLIIDSNKKGVLAICNNTFYLETGMELFGEPDFYEGLTRIGNLPQTEQRIILATGDQVHLKRDYSLGLPALVDEKGNILQNASISCTLPGILAYVKTGESVLFDDGKITGIVEETDELKLTIRITKSKPGGSVLRVDKGINFPNSSLHLKGLTEKDKIDLAFVAKHADVVNMSFVNDKKDVKDLIKSMKALGVLDKLGIILKIETQSAFNKLTEIILEAMQTYPIGIMIARGDLAVEVGWENIGRVQKEILAITEAGLVPNIWATQVLENLAKKGIPSRAEITDVTSALRADCVMLNKGPFIIDAIRLLDTILKNLEPYRDKSKSLYPALEKV